MGRQVEQGRGVLREDQRERAKDELLRSEAVSLLLSRNALISSSAFEDSHRIMSEKAIRLQLL